MRFTDLCKGYSLTAIETRLLEKTAHILTPGMLASPFPAHGIVHASPIDPEYLITRESGMYYESDVLNRRLSTGTLSFYPAWQRYRYKVEVNNITSYDLLYEAQSYFGEDNGSRGEVENALLRTRCVDWVDC